MVANAGHGARVHSRAVARASRPARTVSVMHDCRMAFRRLRARPLTGLACALMLGIGIGSATSTYILLESLVLRPVPFAESDRMARLQPFGFVAPMNLSVLQASGLFSSVEAARQRSCSINTDGSPEDVDAALVTQGLLAMLGARAMRGRVFGPADSAVSGAVVVVSERLWHERFASDEGLIGRQILVDSQPRLVIGILPTAFRFPSLATQLWIPVTFPNAGALAMVSPDVYVRFKDDGPSREQVLALATDLARHSDGGATAQARIGAAPLLFNAGADDYSQRLVWLLFAGGVFVLVALSSNAAGLQLADLERRRREMTLSSILGASRHRLLRQVLVEHGVLMVAGSAIGLTLASLFVHVSAGFWAEALSISTLNPVDMSAASLQATTVAALAMFALACLVPAWLGTRAATGMRPHATVDLRRNRVARHSLLVTQVAVACATLVISGLVGRSLLALAGTERGLSTEGVTVFRVRHRSETPVTWLNRQLGKPDLTVDPAWADLVREVVRGLPEVHGVTLSYGLPPEGGTYRFSERWRADTSGADIVSMTVQEYRVDEHFFDLFRIPIIAGRTFRPDDEGHKAIVGQRFARALWSDADPVGRSFWYLTERFVVIGVARELQYPAPDPSVDHPEFYSRFRPGTNLVLDVSMYCPSHCPPLPDIAQRLAHADPGLELLRTGNGPLNREYERQLRRPRVAALSGGMSAVVASATAGFGLLAMMLHRVRQQLPELAVRVALGASPRKILWLIMQQGLLLSAAGVVLGAALAIVGLKTVTSYLYGVNPMDPVTWVTSLAAIAFIGVGGSWVPARLAARADPSALLRQVLP